MQMHCYLETRFAVDSVTVLPSAASCPSMDRLRFDDHEDSSKSPSHQLSSDFLILRAPFRDAREGARMPYYPQLGTRAHWNGLIVDWFRR